MFVRLKMDCQDLDILIPKLICLKGTMFLINIPMKNIFCKKQAKSLAINVDFVFCSSS